MNKAKPGGIDYLFHAEASIGRVGYTHNIVTGCRHHETGVCKVPCYARRMVERGFLQGHPSYPYGFEPTYHPDRVRAFGQRVCPECGGGGYTGVNHAFTCLRCKGEGQIYRGKPKLIFLNDMGDVGGNWDWRAPGEIGKYSPVHIAHRMHHFANLNSHHILLLTKNPSWYTFAEWPSNVWCGFTATNNEEYQRRFYEMKQANVKLSHMWVSLEPWLDLKAPDCGDIAESWLVIGGLTGPGGKIVQPVSQATMDWLERPFDGRRFVKANSGCYNTPAYRQGRRGHIPREYPQEWKVASDENRL